MVVLHRVWADEAELRWAARATTAQPSDPTTKFPAGETNRPCRDEASIIPLRPPRPALAGSRTAKTTAGLAGTITNPGENGRSGATSLGRMGQQV
jgi:hypothetical protein